MKKRATTPASSPDPERKTRTCLMCRRKFLSAWAGERICKRCKATAAWRNGM